MAESDKTLFEIYRETGYNHGFRSIFYTDLEEHARDKAIAKAAQGETLFSGFVLDEHKDEARALVDTILEELEELDEGTAPPLESITRRLGPFLAP